MEAPRVRAETVGGVNSTKYSDEKKAPNGKGLEQSLTSKNGALDQRILKRPSL